MASKHENFWASSILPKGGDENSIATYAERAPKTKSAKTSAETIFRTRCRTCLVKTVDYMLKNPESSIDIWTSLESKLIVRSPVASGSTESVAPEKITVSTFGALDPETKVQAFLALDDGPSKQMLDAAHNVDPMSIDDLFFLHFQLRKGDRIPEEMKPLVVYRQVMKMRHAEVGNRTCGWFEECVSPRGVVDWTKKPLFHLTWANTKPPELTKVVHISGDSVELDPEEIRITPSWNFEDICSDSEAKFRYKSTVHAIKEWFDSDKGPNQHALYAQGSHMRELASNAQKMIETKKKEVLALCDSPNDTALSTRAKRLREEALEKARAALKARPKKLRALSLEDVTKPSAGT